MSIKNGVILTLSLSKGKDLLFVSIVTTAPHCKYVANFRNRTLMFQAYDNPSAESEVVLDVGAGVGELRSEPVGLQQANGKMP